MTFSKNAVVLGGGGAKGAYEVGVLKALKKIRFRYELITGTSVGSLNGALAAQGDLEIAEKMWLSIDTSRVLDLEEQTEISDTKGLIKQLLKKRGMTYFSLEALLKEVIDEKKLRNSKIEFGLVTVEFPNMKPQYLYKEDIEEGKLIEYLLSSAACFPAMKPYRIEDKLYIDGGYNDNMPIKMAVDKGATKIVAVDLNAIGIVKKAIYPNVEIIFVKSYWPLGDILIFDQKRAKKNIRLGYLDTLKSFHYFEGYYYTFSKHTKEKNFKNAYEKTKGIYDSVAEQHSAFSKLSENAIKKIYQRRVRNKSDFSNEDILFITLEMVMEILHCDPLQIYSYKKAIRDIENKFKCISVEHIEQLNRLIKEIGQTKKFIENADKLTELLKTIDREKILKFIVQFIGKSQSENKNKSILTLLKICAPMEFLSAVYVLSVIKNEKE